MSDSGAGPLPHDAITPPTTFPTVPRLAAALSLLTIGVCCVTLMQLDVPLLRFLRSLDLSSIQRLGDWGEKIGEDWEWSLARGGEPLSTCSWMDCRP
jgi:hypothetical protein